MKANEVFIPGGLPTHTYNPRYEFDLEPQLHEYIDVGLKLLSITGPTKTGKTVLCKRLIPTNSSIWINGGQIQEEMDFWNEILDNLNLFSSSSTSRREGTSEGTSGTLGAGINIAVANFGSKLTGTTAKDQETTSLGERQSNPRSVAVRGLISSNFPLVIDDFHYIPADIQGMIVRALKPAIFEGVRVIILAVPHRAYDAVRVESEMNGRIQQLVVHDWREEELMEIGQKGFPLLNISCSDAVLKKLAEESFGSPNLMQEFCLRLCKKYNNSEKGEIKKEIEEIPQISDFFKQIVLSISSRDVFEKLSRGPPSRSDRISRRFKDGTEGDIYSAILHALANTGPKVKISYTEIRTTLRTILADSPPQLHEISRVLSKMEEISRTSDRNPVIDWDKENSLLYVSDPYFAFYLRWAIRTPSIESPLLCPSRTHIPRSGGRRTFRRSPRRYTHAAGGLGRTSGLR